MGDDLAGDTSAIQSFSLRASRDRSHSFTSKIRFEDFYTSSQYCNGKRTTWTGRPWGQDK